MILRTAQLLFQRILHQKGPCASNGDHFFEPDPHAKYTGQIDHFAKFDNFGSESHNFHVRIMKFSESVVSLNAHISY